MLCCCFVCNYNNAGQPLCEKGKINKKKKGGKSLEEKKKEKKRIKWE